MIEIVNMSSRGQIVIPRSLRKQLGLKRGSRLALIEKNGALVLQKEEVVSNAILMDSSKEDIGWLALAENSMKELWHNGKDEKIWKRYLDDKTG